MRGGLLPSCFLVLVGAHMGEGVLRRQRSQGLQGLQGSQEKQDAKLRDGCEVVGTVLRQQTVLCLRGETVKHRLGRASCLLGYRGTTVQRMQVKKCGEELPSVPS